jgi:hypothetical protein
MDSFVTIPLTLLMSTFSLAEQCLSESLLWLGRPTPAQCAVSSPLSMCHISCFECAAAAGVHACRVGCSVSTGTPLIAEYDAVVAVQALELTSSLEAALGRERALQKQVDSLEAQLARSVSDRRAAEVRCDQQGLVVRSCIEHVTLLCTATVSITCYDPSCRNSYFSVMHISVQVCPTQTSSHRLT